MFRISKRLDYGLQLMVALARETESRLLATATLSERLNIPLPFLHQIGHVLMQAGLIKALPGPKGGLRLSRSAGSITVLNIVEAIEGKVELNPNPMNPNRMNRDSGDYIAPVWDDLQSKILNYLDGINLEQLLEGDTLQVKLMPISSNIGQNSD
jgi:Rrf2 family protein